VGRSVPADVRCSQTAASHHGSHTHSSRGLSVLKVPLTTGKLPFPTSAGTLCIARGESPRGGHGHVVVASVSADGTSLEMVHDPHPEGGFLAGPPAWAAFYAAREPALLSAPSAPSHSSFADELAAAGLDVLAPMRAQWYNEYIRSLGLSTDSTKYLEAAKEKHASGEPEPFALAPLPDYGRSGNALTFLVGNSRALWPAFLRWLQRQPDAAAVTDPVDTYTTDVLRAAVGRFAATALHGASFDIFWASDMSPARLVDMNRAAKVAGVTYFSDEMFLSIHPTFGSWVAFRAVVVFDFPAHHLPTPPPPLPPLLSDDEAAAAKAAFADALQVSPDTQTRARGSMHPAPACSSRRHDTHTPAVHTSACSHRRALAGLAADRAHRRRHA
jgi:methylmalonic aciduria homocystinuria type C protein